MGSIHHRCTPVRSTQRPIHKTESGYAFRGKSKPSTRYAQQWPLQYVQLRACQEPCQKGQVSGVSIVYEKPLAALRQRTATGAGNRMHAWRALLHTPGRSATHADQG